MLLILIVWIIQFFTLWTLGLLVVKTTSWFFKESIYTSILHEIIIGLCVLSVLISYWSIVAKMSGLFVFVAIISVCTLIFYNKEIRFRLQSLLQYLKGISPLSKLSFCIISIFTIIYASGEVRIFDSALYHAQAIRWINEYAVIPGLGNLHSRFAFNSHFFLSQALFDFSFFTHDGHPIFGLNSLFYTIIIFQLMLCMQESQNFTDRIFYFVLICTSSLVILPRIQSPSPDIISFLLVIHLLVYFYSSLLKEKKNETFEYIYFVIVVSYLITVKLSNLPILLFTFCFFQLLSLKNITKAIAVCIVFVLPFFVRNYYLSGYLIYPFPTLDFFNPDWKINLILCQGEMNSIKAWAIAPEMHTAEVLSLGFLPKMTLWFVSLDGFSKLIIMTNGLLIIYLGLKLRKSDTTSRLFWSAIFLNLIYWFLNAPDPRFSLGILTFGFAYIISRIFQKVMREKQYWFIDYFILFGLILCLSTYSIFKWNYIRVVFQKNRIMPEALKTIQYSEYGAIKITQEPDGRCFWAPLPCACQKNEEIIFRTNKIEDGFKIKK